MVIVLYPILNVFSIKVLVLEDKNDVFFVNHNNIALLLFVDVDNYNLDDFHVEVCILTKKNIEKANVDL